MTRLHTSGGGDHPTRKSGYLNIPSTRVPESGAFASVPVFFVSRFAYQLATIIKGRLGYHQLYMDIFRLLL